MGAILGFNRTFMELKQDEDKPLIKSPTGFNRTFMELKLIINFK